MNRDSDSLFTKIAGRLSNVVLLGFFAMLFSLPIVTFGPSMTALNVAMSDYLQWESEKPLKVFFSAFKSKFKASIGIWLINLLLFAAVGLDYAYYWVGEETLDIVGQAWMVALAIILLFETIGSFVVVAEDRAEKLLDIFKTSVDFMFAFFFRGLSLVVLAVTPIVIAFVLVHGILLFLPGVQAYLIYQMVPKMLKDYDWKCKERKNRQ